MAREYIVVPLFLAACGGAAGPAAPTSGAKPTSAESAGNSSDPCAKLPECPAQCPQGVDAVSNRGCGSEGLRCGDDAIECTCTDGLWACAPYERPEGVAQCAKNCRI